jgi:hypothetical protein
MVKQIIIMNPKIDSPIKLYFYKFLRGGRKTIEVDDITLTPEYDEYSDKVYWTMDNPNDSSYSSYTLRAYVEEVAHDFGKMTSEEYFKEVDKKQKLETPQAIYIKPEQENKFLQYAKKTTTFNYKELLMDIQAFDVYPTMDSDGMYFTISVICKNPFDKETNKYLTYKDLKDKLDYYKEWDSYFDYVSFTLFTSLMDYAWSKIPTLFDNTYMDTMCDIRYFTPDKKEIKLW